MNKPTFFIVGNPKSGTTALYNFLKEHPSIFMPKCKEPNYFARDLCRVLDRQTVYYPMNQEEYIALFNEAKENQLCGEASTNYLYSQVAAKEIHMFNSKAKIIIILREPIDFLQSYHLQILKSHISTAEIIKNFQKAFELESKRKKGKNLPAKCLLPELLFYSERIEYLKQIQRFYKLFNKEQIKLIIYDDWKKNNDQVYKDILTFLEVDSNFFPEFKTHYKGGMKVRFKWMQESLLALMHGKKYWQPIKLLIKLIFPQQNFRRKIMSSINQNVIFTPTEPISPEFENELRQTFKQEVISLSKFIDRDLVALWGYESSNSELDKATSIKYEQYT